MTLRGKPYEPNIILDDGLLPGILVSKFTLMFYDSDYHTFESIKLNHENIRSFPSSRLIDLISQSDYKKGFRLKLKGTDLFVHDWHQERPFGGEDQNKFPLFSKFKPLVMPEEVANKFRIQIQNYSVELDEWSNPNIIND